MKNSQSGGKFSLAAQKYAHFVRPRGVESLHADHLEVVSITGNQSFVTPFN